MAVTSSEITNLARTNIAKSLCHNESEISYDYYCMGVANGSTVAAKSDTKLVGNESYYTNESGEYESSYKAKWVHVFGYNDLTSHKFGEAGVFKNESETENYMLGRIVFDEVTLNESDYLQVTMRARFPSA